MRWNIVIVGIIIFLISFAIWAYDQPKIDLLSQGLAQLALLNKQVREQYQELQGEVFFAKVGMAVGLITIVIGVLVRREKPSYFCRYCGHMTETEKENYNHSLSCEKNKQQEPKE